MAERDSNVLAGGERIGLEPPVLEAVAQMLDRTHREEALAIAAAAAFEALTTAPWREAAARVGALDLERHLGRDDARTLYLALVLRQVPLAEARHARLGIDPAMTRATFEDIGVWARHFHRQTGMCGITLEIVDWSQHYLSGLLLRVGAMQLDLLPFSAPVRVHRHRETRALVASTLDGRAIDLTTGELDTPAPPLDDEWTVVLEPGTPALEMHIPANTFITLRGAAQAIKTALPLFARLAPDVAPVGAYGEAWLLDPQARTWLPRNRGIHDLQKVCGLYPSNLPEAKTIKRLFGPDVTREDIPRIPRDVMNTLQRRIADFLGEPSASLRARGGFILREELEQLEVWE